MFYPGSDEWCDDIDKTIFKVINSEKAEIMDEATAIKILDLEFDENNVGRILRGTTDYLRWMPGDETVEIDGHFTADQLEAVAWWMRKYAKPT